MQIAIRRGPTNPFRYRNLIQWAYAYFTFQRGVRLITASDRMPRKALAPQP